MKVLFAIAIALLTLPASAAIQIPGLFNTGVDNSLALQPDLTVDIHYSITATTAVAYTPDDAYTYANLAPLYAIYPGSWVGNTATSQWIGPALDIVEPSDPTWAGTYTYDLTFDLTGLDPSTAQISGLWASDNGSQIFLNNIFTGYIKGSSGYSSLDPFSITSGFLPGLNTLRFLVVNDLSVPPLPDNPSGLHVSALAGTAEAAVVAVPEPTMFVVWLGLITAALACAGTRHHLAAAE
jgi:hypothetical protein